MSLTAGQLLGHYEILAPLGSGGMGEVYRARDSRLGREVAVKVLPPHLIRDTESLGRFEREARALAALSHPNILVIFDFASEEDLVYAVMELLEGQTLRKRLDAGKIPYENALEIASSIAEGLSAAHSKGVVHRDLKPENIFLTEDGRVKILDFGLVRWDRPLSPEEITSYPTTPLQTRTGMVMGTVHYMSPEQVRGIDVDLRSDIFSFGCILYEMVVGARPFTGETLPETMVAILKQQTPQMNTLATPVLPDFEKLVQTCLEKEPSLRFQSAHDLSIALKMLIGNSRSFKATPFVTPQPKRAIRRKKEIDSLAVLPFLNASEDADAEYLSDGITEALINTLSQIPKLRVMARSTVFRFKGKEADPRIVGRELGVRGVVTGRLVHRGDVLSVHAELVDAEDGSQIWGEQYQQKACDIQTIQQDISQHISSKLKFKLVGADKKKLSKVYTDNMQAYRLYLQGRFHWNKRTAEGLMQGIEFFQKAIDLDPQFALAYVGLSDSYHILGGFYFMPPDEAYPKAKAAAEKALKIDPRLGEAYGSLGVIMERYDWDWPGAERNFRRAIELNPGYATAHQWFGVSLTMVGRGKEGLEEMDIALDMDPLSFVMTWTKSYLLYYQRQYDEAIKMYERTMEIDPSFQRAQYDIALVYLMKGMKEEAFSKFSEWMKIAERNEGNLALFAYAHAVMGETEKAVEILRSLESRTGEGAYVSYFSFVLIHLGLGDVNSAMQCLQRAYINHEDAMISLRMNPRLDPLRSDPRFAEMLIKVGY